MGECEVSLGRENGIKREGGMEVRGGWKDDGRDELEGGSRLS